MLRYFTEDTPLVEQITQDLQEEEKRLRYYGKLWSLWYAYPEDRFTFDQALTWFLKYVGMLPLGES